MSRRALGILCLAGVVLIWVVSAETIQFIFRKEDFRAPFFLTYFNTSLFALYLLGFLFRPAWWGEREPPAFLFWFRWLRRPASTLNESLTQDALGEGEEAVAQFSLWQVVKIAFWFCPLWFGANYLYNLSLTLTSASSSTILSSSSSLFTLALGLLLKVERGSIWKLIGVLLTVLGVVLVSLMDTGRAQEHAYWVGDVVAVLGALVYAGYAVYLKVIVLVVCCCCAFFLLRLL